MMPRRRRWIGGRTGEGHFPPRALGFGREGILAAAANFAKETSLPGQRAEIKLQP